MALYSRLSGGGSSTCRRSTKKYSGKITCENYTTSTVFEFEGSGKVNKVSLEQSVYMGNNAYFIITVDGVEFYKYPNSAANATIFHLVRSAQGSIVFTTSNSPTDVLPLDIEFKNEFKITAYSTNNTPTVNYDIELAAY